MTNQIPDIEGLRSDVRDLASVMEDFSIQTQRNKKTMWVLSVSLLVDFALSIGLGYVGITATDASDKATKASSASSINCKATNAAKATEKVLWDSLFSFPQIPDPTETAEARAQRETQTQKFKDLIDRNLSPTDCKKVS